MLRSVFAFVFVFLALPCSSLAVDALVLKNGDRITGTIQALEDGELTFETPWAGAVKVKWSRIAELESEESFEVETETGRIYRGSVTKFEESLEVTSEDTTVELDTLGVTSMRPRTEEKPRGFWKRLNGGINFGYSLARGNSNSTQSSVGISADYRRPAYEIQGEIVSLTSEQEDGEGTSRHALDVRYDRFLSDKSFLFTLGGLERNERQLLNLRSKVGGGFGRKLIRSQQTQLSTLAGFNFANEQFRGDATNPARTRNSGEALAGIDLTTTRFFGIEFTTRLFVFPNLTQTGRYRLEYDSGFSIPLIGGFTWGLNLYDRFDSDPPVDVERNDYGVVSSLGYKF